MFFMAYILVWSIRNFQSRQMMSTQLDLLSDLQIVMQISQVPLILLFTSSSEASYASSLKLNSVLAVPPCWQYL